MRRLALFALLFAFSAATAGCGFLSAQPKGAATSKTTSKTTKK